MFDVTSDSILSCSECWNYAAIYILLTYESSNVGRLVDNHILEAIVNMKEQKGSDKVAIASFIEVFVLHFTNDCKI